MCDLYAKGVQIVRAADCNPFVKKGQSPFLTVSPLFPGFPEAGGDISVLFVLHQAERDLFPFGTVEGGVGSLQNLSG